MSSKIKTLKVPTEVFLRQKILDSLEESVSSKLAILNLLPYIVFETDLNGTIVLATCPKNNLTISVGDSIWQYIKNYDVQVWKDWIACIEDSSHSSRNVELDFANGTKIIPSTCTIIKLPNKIVGTMIELDGRIIHGFDVASQNKLSENLYIQSLLENIADTIRTPLTTISFNTELALLDLVDSDLIHVKSNLSNIAQCIDTIDYNLKILEIIRTFSLTPIENNKFKISIENIKQKCSSMLDEVCLHFKFETCDLPKNSYLAGYSVWFEKMLECVLDNSIKYATSLVLIKISLLSDKSNMLEIAITDDGTGISASMMHQLQNAGWRGDTSLTRNIKGLGMGFTYLREYLNKTKGSFTINSSLNSQNSHTTIAIKLPFTVQQD